jgi:hypothetical protein
MILSLLIGLAMFVLTLALGMVPTGVLIRIATSRNPRSLTRPSYPANSLLFQLAAVMMFLWHLVNIALWAIVFHFCGEFLWFDEAFYHSAVNYSSLGYGDIVMSQRWRLLGPLEAIDGIVMFSLSTALIFALLMQLIERRRHAKANTGVDQGALRGEEK